MMKLYLMYIKIVIHAILQYRLSFVLLSIAQFFAGLFALFGVYFLFRRFGGVGGWTFAEAAVCFGIIRTSYALAECIGRGFDSFSRMVSIGDFDRVLLRPKNTVLQVMGYGFEITKIGGFVQGIVVLLAALPFLNVQWDVLRVLTVFFMLTGGTFIFMGISILGAAACFFTVQNMDIIGVFSGGGQELASYPMTIFPRMITRFFTYIIPFGCVNYLPLMFLTGRDVSSPLLYAFLPLAGVLFIVPCLFIWNFGVRHYASTGS